MKRSQYNHFLELADGTVLAFNSASGALVEIEKNQRSRIEYLLDHSNLVQTDQDRQYVQYLIDGGYLVPDDLDELHDLKTKSRNRRARGTTMALTIAPTLACNFDCDYCFENRSTVHMTRDVEKALLAFVDRELGRVLRLRVCWFGGEPTLRMQTIDRVQSELLERAESRQVEFPPGLIISNGYLLDGKMAEKLKNLRVEDVQITLDGPKQVHDKRRKLRSGKGSFERIVENMSETAHILKIRVRVNVDKDNVESAYEVIEELDRRGILPEINLYFAQVKSYGEACANVRGRCFCEEDFARSLVKLYRKLIEMGVYKVDYPKVYGGVFCGAVAEGTYVISPSGLIFRCWEELSSDPGKSIGDIFSKKLSKQQSQNINAYRSWDPFSMKQCLECDVMPLCLGGCPYHGIIESVIDKGICSPWKFNLDEMLELRYRCEVEKEAIAQR